MSSVLELCSNAIRGVLVAPPGKKLVVADLSNIEGRVLAWLAGEAWKLQAFRDYDAGSGPDLYKLAYAKAFGVTPEDVDKAQRQIGKVMELMLGFEGGVGAYITGAATYGIDLEAMAESAIGAIPDDTLDQARDFLQWQRDQGRSQHGLSDQAFLVCDAFKRLWREAHPAISSWWPELKHTAIAAVERPGVTLDTRGIKVRRDGAWLRLRLPSGRYLCYPQPRVDDGALSYMGIDQYTRRWQRIKTYGGKLAENVTQAAARDVLAHSMPRIEAAGYAIVLTVHDEVISEAPDIPDFNPEHLAALMASNPPWAEGLPLAAAGFEAYRYRKD